MANFPILSIIIFLPALCALHMMFFMRQEVKSCQNIYPKYVAILSAVLSIISVIIIALKFNFDQTGFQFIETFSLIPSLNIHYKVGIDGISLIFISLTTLLIAICIIESLVSVNEKAVEYLTCFLFLQTFILGAFCALDMVLFYMFFEAILIPMILIIGIWGGKQKIYAAYKFFLYTFFGSILFLVALLLLYKFVGTFDITELSLVMQKQNINLKKYLWFSIFISMAIKIPMLPFHTWLPNAHVQAPTGGSVILAGILLKLGAYGIIRFLMPIAPEHCIKYADTVILISVIGIIYGSLAAMAQQDMKKMIAYSSVAHMGYVTAGLFSLNEEGLSGATFQMISHGIISGGLFLVVGFLYKRMHTKEIDKYGGMCEKMPKLASLMLILVMGSVGLPGTAGFIGEFKCLVAIFLVTPSYAAIAVGGVVLGAVYMLKLYKTIMLGPMSLNVSKSNLEDLSNEEFFLLLILVCLVFIIGIFPQVILSAMEPTISQLVSSFIF